MPAICLYLKAHQPRRVRHYGIFDIGKKSDYFVSSEDRLDNKKILQKVVKKSYIPTNALLLEFLKKYPEFKVSFSLTGVLIDQLEEFAPEVIESFQELVKTGRVEILGETYYHSLSFFYSRVEFEKQVELHRKRIEKLFGITPAFFSNTELAYNNDLAQWAEGAGYKGLIAEGWDPILEWRSPNYVYQPVNTERIGLLLKNYKLSDDIAFRFSERSWEEWPLTVEKYVSWINALEGDAQTVNLFMDYETFGEHQWEETGIFEFLQKLPGAFLKKKGNTFMTPSEVVDTFKPVGYIDVPNIMTWADTDRDLSAWVGNKMQRDAIETVYEIEDAIYRLDDAQLLNDWRHLLTSDHFYYMCTKWFADGDVHAYFNPYDSPYEAFIAYMNAVKDIKIRVERLATGKSGRGGGKREPKPVQ